MKRFRVRVITDKTIHIGPWRNDKEPKKAAEDLVNWMRSAKRGEQAAFEMVLAEEKGRVILSADQALRSDFIIEEE